MPPAPLIDDVKLLKLTLHRDDRGFFAETYNQREIAKAGIRNVFVQDNQSLSKAAGIVRGLHFQSPPFAQDKLIRVLRGRIFDVAVDIRHGSPTFGKHVGVELNADDGHQLFVPVGFAHGFCTLEPDTEVLYKVSAYYEPAHDKGIAWNDPALGIEWPIAPHRAVLSAKDRALPRLAEIPAYFEMRRPNVAVA